MAVNLVKKLVDPLQFADWLTELSLCCDGQDIFLMAARCLDFIITTYHVMVRLPMETHTCNELTVPRCVNNVMLQTEDRQVSVNKTSESN